MTRTLPPALRAPCDLAREMEATLSVTGVDKIWPAENTDDEDSSEHLRTLTSSHATHAPGPTGSTKGPQMLRQDQRRTLARRPLETIVCTSLRDPAAGLCLHSSNGPTATTWHSPRTTISTVDLFLVTNCFIGGKTWFLGKRFCKSTGVFFITLSRRDQSLDFKRNGRHITHELKTQTQLWIREPVRTVSQKFIRP